MIWRTLLNGQLVTRSSWTFTGRSDRSHEVSPNHPVHISGMSAWPKQRSRIHRITHRVPQRHTRSDVDHSVIIGAKPLVPQPQCHQTICRVSPLSSEHILVHFPIMFQVRSWSIQLFQILDLKYIHWGHLCLNLERESIVNTKFYQDAWLGHLWSFSCSTMSFEP